MEKAIEIKRRAQRCIQNGDLDGAANEYEKLVLAEDSDPYNFVLLADLLYKKGDHPEASRRYLQAVSAYERATLFKNAIAVCKKMLRLSLTPAAVTRQLAQLHQQDGLASEASLYYLQYAEHLVRANDPREATDALRKAFEASPENIKVLEQLAEAWMLADDPAQAVQVLGEAARHYRERGLGVEANRVEARARQLSGAPAPAVNLDAPLSLDSLTLDPAPPARGTIAAPGLELPPAPAGDAAVPRPLSDLMQAGPVALEPGGAPFAPPVREVPRLELDSKPAPFRWGEGEAAEGVAAESDAGATASPNAEAPAATNAIAGLSGAMAPPTWRNDDSLVVPSATATPVEPEPEPEPATAESADADEMVYEIRESDVSDVIAPGPPAPAPEPAPVSVSSAMLRVPGTLTEVEKRLHAAQECFNRGERERATGLLVEAAQAYESLGRLDNAASIYRSLGRNAQTPAQALKLWLANCEKRADLAEAAEVACELGDRAIQEDDASRAREWFERARTFDPSNELARRRLQRLDQSQAPAAANPTLAGGIEPGRVEVALGRAEAVTFDLGSLLSEFQRGVEAQLSGDAQSHYDLGVTYREMGLLEQAVDAFRVAEQTPGLAARALEMIGRCLVDQGRPAEAAIEFERAITALGSADVHVGELLQQLGMAYEQAGEQATAREVYERVDAESAAWPEVAARLERLRGEAA